MWQRGASALRTEPALVAFVALAAIAYSVFSLVRYEQFAHGFDLAIFDQVVWHYSRFEAPASSVKNLESIWGDHFSPILALLGPRPLPALAHAVTHPDLVLRTLFGSATKTHTLTYLFVPFLGLMLCSRTVILLAPLVAERFLSTNELLWTTGGHYTLAVAAVLIIGAADGLSNLRRLAPAPVRRLLVIGVAGVVLVLNVAFTRSFTLSFTHLAHSDFYETPAWVKDARRALAAVPADVSVAAQDNVVPRLVHRDIAAEISPTTGATDYVVDNGIGTVINGGFGSVSRYVNARLASHVPVAYVNGWLVLRAKSLPPVARAPQLVAMSAVDAARIKAARSGWATALDEYARDLASCVSKPKRGVCAKPLGEEFRRRQARLDRELVRVRSSLKTGCLAQSMLAAVAARVVSDTLEATRRAAAQGAPAELSKRSTVLQETLAKDAPGYVTRFAALCSPSSPPGKAVS